MIDNPRLDLLVARYGMGLVVALAVLGVVALGASAWAVATPQTDTVEQQVDDETIETELTTSAVVVDDGLWEQGTVLEDNPVYLQNATPTLQLHTRTSVPSADTEVIHDVELVYEAVRDEKRFWEQPDPVSRDAPSAEGAIAESDAEIRIDEIRDQRRSLEDELAGVGSVDVTLRVTTSYDTGTNDGELTMETPLRTVDGAYWLDEPTPTATESYTETQEIEVSESRSPVLVGLLALLGVLSLSTAWLFSRWSAVDEVAARQAVHERRYAEWISRGSIPMWIGEHHISLDTLEDVVDVAIDTNERVVHDRQRGLFAVVNDDVVYYYTDRGLWEETAWPSMDLDDSRGALDATSPPPEGSPPDGGSPDDRLAGGVDATDIDPDDEDAWRQL